MPADHRTGDNDPTQTFTDAVAGSAQLCPGDVLGGRFEIIQFLNRGGMGEVYEASDLELQGKHIALKTLRQEIAGDESMRQRFEREVLVAREISHQNVCPTYDLFRMQGPRGPVTFLTMRLLRGESLSASLKRTGRLPNELAADIARQIAAGLDAAHAAGIIHRDFKPGNVMLESQGDSLRAVVTDFGLARPLISETNLTRFDNVPGTLAYMAPELLPPESRPASVASDVFALGVVLHEMITGERPSAGTPPSKLVAGLRPQWDTVVRGCLQRDPAKRFRSAGDAVAILDRVAPRKRGISRRTAILTASGALAGGAWFAWPKFDAILHPLPATRFIALIAWPPVSNDPARSLVNGVLDVIANRLIRAESEVKKLLVIRPSDVGQQVNDPKEVVNTLGANLVLAASLSPSADSLILVLRVIEAATERVLRQRRISLPPSDANHLPERASVVAASLLQLPLPQRKSDAGADFGNVAAAAYQNYTAAEEARRQPNDTALDQAIAKYQQALELDQGFALAYARLATAYTRKYFLTRDAAFLRLAERNADRAVSISPGSPRVVFSRATVDLFSGKNKEAIAGMEKAEQMDPGNPEILTLEAAAFDNLDQRAKAEQIYRRIISKRPNYWPAYNDLGVVLKTDGHLNEAAQAFEEGAAVAPQVALPLANAGSVYLLQGHRDDAIRTFERSIQIAPNEFAYSNLGNLAFDARDYKKALGYYEKARDLSPKSDYCWRNIADCYAAMGNRKSMAENYARAADILAEHLHANPSRGDDWMTLAFYHAKTGRRDEAEADIREAESRGATRLDAQFTKAQALAVLGKKDEALRIVLHCLDNGLSPVQVDYAMDLQEIRSDPRYRRRVAELKAQAGKAG